MRPSAGGRFCESCGRHVHDLTRATETQARAVALLFGGGRMCGRARFDAGGRPVFRPEPRASQAPVGRRLGLVAAVGLAAPGAACSSTQPAPTAGAAESAEACEPSARVAVEPPELAAAPAPRDRDGDGFTDADDACPTDAGVAPDGCPRRVIVTSSGDMVVLQFVQFERGRATLDDADKRILAAVVEVLSRFPEIRVVVEGHAASDERTAERLSEVRAHSVVAYLVDQGVDASKLVPKGLGTSLPLDSNQTPEGRARNRRVSFRVESAP